jgi:hypothetical protein
MTSRACFARTSRGRLGAFFPDLEPGSVGFLDSADDADVLWGRAYRPEPSLDEVAAREFAATAKAATDALRGMSPEGVEVVGAGILAALVARVLGPRSGEGAPTVMLDTSGSSARIRDALEQCDRLGTVLLAAPPVEAEVDARTYTDLHVRGLTIVGVPWVGEPTDEQAPPELVAWAQEQLAPLHPDELLSSSPWYRVDR